MSLAEDFKQHIIDCPQCDAAKPTQLCGVGQAMLTKIVRDTGTLSS